MKRTLTVMTLFIVAGFFSGLMAQRSCNTAGHQEELMKDPVYAKNFQKRIAKFKRFAESVTDERALCANPVLVPIAVHFQNVSNPDVNCLRALAQNQVDILNNDYQGTNSDISIWTGSAASYFPGVSNGEACIQFCLASFNHPSGYGLSNGDPAVTVNAFTGDNNSDWSGYINIFVRNISYLGYSPLGGNGNGDGVVIDNNAFGSGSGCGSVSPSSPYNLGRTLTHELGHYLLLDHIWGGGGASCTDSDNVGDTPNQSSEYYGCPSLGANSCGSNDMHMNYMDYVNDACMYMFSAGQATRMENYLSSNLSNVTSNASSVCSGGSTPTCSDGIQNGNETGVDCGGSSCPACPCSGTNVTVSITLDNYPEETSWSITQGGSTVASGGTYGSEPDGSTVNISTCLDDGCYTFTISDAYGDGICCSYGNGSYTVSAGGTTYASGGSFASSEATDFCIGGGGGPTCDDGVQNGTETGVDCGGSCPACPTCSDGIQNGNETGVDCGGSCAACPTCSDGIQNGNETGVDCGGSCAPCGGGGCTYESINSNNFDGGWGIWNDGGSDCRRSSRDASYANSGSFCVRLRDNTSTSTMTTDNLNLSGYDELTIDFSYIARSMENNEDFWMQISTNGGSSYSTVDTWSQGSEFTNNVRGSGSSTISGPFTSTTRLRIRCDASGNSDWVYIDDVVITGCANGARQAEATSAPAPESQIAIQNQIENLNLYPNPTRSELTIAFNLNTNTDVKLYLTDFTGKMILIKDLGSQTGTRETSIDVNQFANGFYFVHLVTDEKRIARKFSVIH